MNETSTTKGGIRLNVVRVLVLATTLLVALPALDMGDIMPLILFGVVLPMPLYITLWLLRSEERPDSLRSGLSLARSLGLVLSLLLIVELYSNLFVVWPTHPGLIALLSAFLISQIVIVAGSSILLKRLNTSGLAPAKTVRALTAVAYSLVVLSVIAFVTLPFRVGSGLPSRESSAMSRLKSFVSSEAIYAGANGGLYGTPECLVTPSQCLANYPAGNPVFLTPDFLASENRGYTFTFHPGNKPSAEEIKTAGAVPGSLKTWAYAAIPVAPGRSGVRSFCIDETGVLRMTTDGTIPSVVGGRCPETMTPIS
jgi:hypothetical protein